MRPIGISPSRRSLLKRALTAAPAIVAASGEITHPARMLAASAQNQVEIYRPKYFTAEEWTLLTALVGRLIPADEEGPGALEVGVAEFIDRQVNEPYGRRTMTSHPMLIRTRSRRRYSTAMHQHAALSSMSIDVPAATAPTARVTDVCSRHLPAIRCCRQRTRHPPSTSCSQEVRCRQRRAFRHHYGAL